MSLSTAVTEQGVTITASADEAEIRESAGFPDAPPPAEADPAPAPTPEPDAVKTADQPRTDDGKFDKKPKFTEGDPRKSFQAKINEERRLRGEAERRALQLEQELESARAPHTPPAPEPSPVRQAPYRDLVKRYQTEADWPKIEDFASDDFPDAYAGLNAAQSAYILDKQLQERDARSHASAEADRARDRVRAVSETGRQAHADWDDLLATDHAKTELSEPVLAEIYDDPDTSADVIYHLLTHPEDIETLATITHPIAAARAITRIRLSVTSAPSGPEPTPKPVTKAKPLIKPVSASPTPPEAPSTVDLPLAKYIAIENERERRDRDARRGA